MLGGKSLPCKGNWVVSLDGLICANETSASQNLPYHGHLNTGHDVLPSEFYTYILTKLNCQKIEIGELLLRQNKFR